MTLWHPTLLALELKEEDESLNATGCFENLEGGLYHVAVYDADAGGTVDWQNRALFLTAVLNWTASPNQLNTSKNIVIWTAENNHACFCVIIMRFCMLSYHNFLLHGCIHMLKGSHNLESWMLGTSHYIHSDKKEILVPTSNLTLQKGNQPNLIAARHWLISLQVLNSEKAVL